MNHKKKNTVGLTNPILQTLYWGIACLLLFSSCAHRMEMERKVEAEVQAEPSPSPQISLFKESQDAIEEASDLNVEQKAKLKTITLEANQELSALREEEIKTRLLLLRKLMDPKVADAEINTLKNHILTLDKRRTNRWLSALDDTRAVLGRSSKKDHRIYRSLSEPLPAKR